MEGYGEGEPTFYCPLSLPRIYLYIVKPRSALVAGPLDRANGALVRNWSRKYCSMPLPLGFESFVQTSV